jgi:hypothetical protein
VASDDPWITLFKQVHAKYIPDEQFTNTVVFGMAQAYTFAQALRLAGILGLLDTWERRVPS